MANPMTVIDKLQQMLDLQYEATRDDLIDVPYVDDDEYDTNRTYGEQEEITEAEEDEEAAAPPEEAGMEAPAEPAPEEAAPEDPAAAGGDMGGEMGAEDPAMAGGDMGGDMGGMGDMGAGDPQPMSPKNVGRAYELKKLYSRLVSLEKYLTDISEPHLVELRGYVSNAVDLFRTVTTNFDSYKEKLDDIIVTFYKFLQEAYMILKKYYKKEIDNEE